MTIISGVFVTDKYLDVLGFFKKYYLEMTPLCSGNSASDLKCVQINPNCDSEEYCIMEKS